jgi:Lon protease-like protein
MPRQTVDTAIFPLDTVLFPGGRLPLKIFEQRYLDMTKDCIRDNALFGVFLITDGGEVGAPAECEDIGCLAAIIDWEMPQLGIFHLVTEGRDKVQIVSRRVETNGLIRGEVELLPAESSVELPADFRPCAQILQLIIERTGEEFFPQPARYDDALWVGYRLAEILPMEQQSRQKLLELTDPRARMRVVRELMRQQGFEV